MLPISKNKIRSVLHDERFKYLIIGALTTAIDWITFAACDFAGMNDFLSSAISWIVAVAFAFWGNKYVVFSDLKTETSFLYEVTSFFLSRVATGAFTIISVPLLAMVINKYIAKAVVSVVVIVANYVLAKMFTFKTKIATD